MPDQLIVAIDGHDGAGKTTVARIIAEQLGGEVVKPFRGSLGDLIAWLWRGEKFDLADRIARSAVAKCREQTADISPVVFDRHWLTMYTVLPVSFFANWEPLPLTILCWADLETTLKRLAARGEEIGNPDSHQFYLSRYIEYARRYNVPVVDTSQITSDEAAAVVVSIVRSRFQTRPNSQARRTTLRSPIACDKPSLEPLS